MLEFFVLPDMCKKTKFLVLGKIKGRELEKRKGREERAGKGRRIPEANEGTSKKKKNEMGKKKKEVRSQ